MKKPYQIEAQRAVRQLEEMAADGNPAVQMVLPMAEMVGWLRQGVGALIRQAGLRVMELLMEEEVRERVGERSRPATGSHGQPVGQGAGLLRGDGPESADRPPARTHDRRPGSTVRRLRDVSPRPATDRNGVGETDARSERESTAGRFASSPRRTAWRRAPSANIIEASRVKLKEMMERRLDQTRLCALLIDATPFAGQQMVAALGIGPDRAEDDLGIRQGATENATVVGELWVT